MNIYRRLIYEEDVERDERFRRKKVLGLPPRRGRDGSTIRRYVKAGRIRLRSFKEQAIAQVSVFHRFARQHCDRVSTVGRIS